MTLRKLPPRLATVGTDRLPTLETKAGSTARIRGPRWLGIKQRVKVRDNYTCAGCGRVSNSHECDHITPLEQGGSNGDENLQLLCADCHDVKTKAESRNRRGKR